MLIVLLSWMYILAVCLAAGCAVFALLERILPLSKEHSFAGMTTAGVVLLTVYAEYYSLFDGIGMLCHLIMLAGIFACMAFSVRARELFTTKCMRLKRLLGTNTGIFLLAVVLMVAFFTSRGSFHTDTGIYHAAAIRWNEEYGVVKGLANLDLHYGYNSSYLVFCSLFTFSWIPGIGATAAGEGTLALHTTTGFLAALYMTYACGRLRYVLEHKRHLADAARCIILMYFFTNAVGMMSPATDYGTLLISSYITCAWLDVYETGRIHVEQNGERPQEQVYEYGLIAMLALFAVSMKLSCAAMFGVVLYPLAVLLRKGAGRPIALYVSIGIILFLPFLIRNVILSGWLFYPFESIDLFHTAWKVPYEYSKVDSDQIKVWGRCLYDITKVDLPIREWFPVWWSAQSDYGQMLLYGVALSPAMFFIDARLVRGRKERVGIDFYLLVAMLYFSVFLWFMTAPFIRYGLTFLLLTAVLPAAAFLDLVILDNRQGIWKVPGMFLAGIIMTCGSMWVGHYARDDLSFVKQHLLEPYYLMPQPFDTRDEDTVTIENADGSSQLDIYAAGSDEINSYYAFPGTCYSFMTERSRMLGDAIEDGFAAK